MYIKHFENFHCRGNINISSSKSNSIYTSLHFLVHKFSLTLLEFLCTYIHPQWCQSPKTITQKRGKLLWNNFLRVFGVKRSSTRMLSSRVTLHGGKIAHRMLLLVSYTIPSTNKMPTQKLHEKATPPRN